MTMTDYGKAFEYALALQLSKVTETPISQDGAYSVTRGAYRGLGAESEAMDKSAAEAVLFLQAYDKRFDDAISVHIQSDRHGKQGDVRDVVLEIFGGEIGLSAKNNHRAVKHSRLSSTIDFGARWADYPVSSHYWKQVRPIFGLLADLQEQGELFRNIPNKEASIYLPVLTAFEDEFVRLCQSFGSLFIKRVFQYLVGRHDFYKVVRERDTVSIESYNINGTLGWGRRWRIPEEVEQVKRKQGSNNTLLVTFAGGWQMSFRIHNARSKVEPSLKFDIQFVAMPTSVGSNQIPFV